MVNSVPQNEDYVMEPIQYELESVVIIFVCFLFGLINRAIPFCLVRRKLTYSFDLCSLYPKAMYLSWETTGITVLTHITGNKLLAHILFILVVDLKDIISILFGLSVFLYEQSNSSYLSS